MNSFLLSLSVLLMSLFAASASQLPVGIEMIFNHGEVIEGLSCSDGEMADVHTFLYDQIAGLEDSDRFRHLKTVESDNGTEQKGDTSECEERCMGFPRGTCFIAYPECLDYRRNLAPRRNVRLGNRALSKEQDGQDLLDLCKAEKHVILDGLRGGLDSVSDSCNGHLAEHIDFVCFRIY